MPSGKRSKQQRRATPPPVRSTGGGSSLGSRRTWLIVAVVILVLAGLGVGLDLALGSSGSSTSSSSGTLAPLSTLGKLVSPGPLGPPGPEAPPVETGPSLAPTGSPQPGQSVDGITCEVGGEQVAFHHHSRLTIFVNGRPRSVPYGVGIADPKLQPGIGVPFVDQGACFSWLHTHAADGIIHIEAPRPRTFTLGNFFDVWGQPLSSTLVGPAKGQVTALYNGQVWQGNPRNIPLREHSQIQLEVGHPLVAPVHITDWGGL